MDIKKETSKDFWSDAPDSPAVAPAQVAHKYQETNTFALLSLIFGITGVFFSVVASIPAIVLGHMALRKMRVSGEPGRNFALIGLWLGYVKLIIDVLLIILFVLFFAGAFFAAIAAGSNPDYLANF